MINKQIDTLFDHYKLKNPLPIEIKRRFIKKRNDRLAKVLKRVGMSSLSILIFIKILPKLKSIFITKFSAIMVSTAIAVVGAYAIYKYNINNLKPISEFVKIAKTNIITNKGMTKEVNKIRKYAVGFTEIKTSTLDKNIKFKIEKTIFGKYRKNVKRYRDGDKIKYLMSSTIDNSDNEYVVSVKLINMETSAIDYIKTKRVRDIKDIEIIFNKASRIWEK